MSAAMLFFLGAFVTRKNWPWGPLCLLALGISAGVLLFSADAVVEGPSRSSVESTVEDATSQDSSQGKSPRPLSLICDGISEVFAFATLGLGVLLTLPLCGVRQTDASAELFACLLLALAGLMLVGMANDLVVLFLSLELIALSTYMLLYVHRSDDVSHQVATKHLLLGIFSSALLAYGLSLLYGLTGTTNLLEIRAALASGRSPLEPGLMSGEEFRIALPALVFIFAGLGSRTQVVPYHFGVSESFQKISTWAAGLLATIPKAAGFVALVHLITAVSSGAVATAQLLSLVLAAVTMTVGNVMALSQTRIRRILAYTATAHGGFVLMGIAAGLQRSADVEPMLSGSSGIPGGIEAGLFYLGSYLLSAAGLFAVLIYLCKTNRQVEYIDDLRGLCRTEPVAAVCALVFLLSLSSIPPFPGFWGVVLLLLSSLAVPVTVDGLPLPLHHTGFVLLAFIAVLNLLLTVAVYLRIVIAMMLQDPISLPRPCGGRPALATAVLAAVLALGVGLFPGAVLGLFK